MNDSHFTPEQSLQLIDSIIKKAKNRFEENGFAFIIWGITIAVCCYSQAFLLYKGFYKVSWYPYLIMPLVSIYTFWYFAQKKTNDTNPLTLISSRLWLFVGINIMVIAFAYNDMLKDHLTPFIFILLGIATAVASSLIKSNLLLFCALIINGSGFIAFHLAYIHHPLLMGSVAIITFLIPGIILRFNEKRKNV